MSRSCCRWSMRFRQSAANPDALASAPTSFKAIVVTTLNRTDENCVSVGLNRSLPSATRSTKVDWVFCVGRSNELWLGCINFDVSVNDTIAVTISTKHS